MSTVVADIGDERRANGSVKKLRPHDHDSEAAVLGAMLLSVAAVDQASAMLRADSFDLPAHQSIFEAIVTLRARGDGIDPVTVAGVLEDLGLLEQVGGPAVLTDLQANTPSIGNVSTHAARVATAAKARRLQHAGREMADAALRCDFDAVVKWIGVAGDDAAGTFSDQLRSQLLTDDELDNLPKPEPLVAGILSRHGMSVLYGRPGSFKSFVAIDLALSIASGCWWFGHAVTAGPVLYVIAEGAEGIADRRAAWKDYRRVYQVDGMHWLPTAVNLLDPTQVAALATIARTLNPALVVIDTLSRCIAGGNENAPETMTSAVDAVDRIRTASAAHVLLVHHSPKDGSTPRGHGALEGAADTIIEAKTTERAVTLTCTKQKNSREFEPIRLRLTAHRDSAVLTDQHYHEDADSDPAELTPNERALLDAVIAGADSAGLSPSALQKMDVIPEGSYYRTQKSLVTRGLIVNVGTKQRPRYTTTDQADQ